MNTMSTALLFANLLLAISNVCISVYYAWRAPLFRIPFSLSALSSITLVILTTYQISIGVFSPTLLTRTGITISLIFSLGVVVSMAILVKQLYLVRSTATQGNELIVLVAENQEGLQQIVETSIRKCTFVDNSTD